ncbi:TetR/AcrR family transcriptional regulator [Nocardioides sp.]|uniref:TetR/AcrR family transcriptional regulator n=1 Tax=Nocardioides sp. TaxID=35761 RepID=UPI0039E2AE92
MAHSGPGRPRRTGVEDAVLAATVSLVREQGYAGTTLDAIAREAGVAKTTVYRRWASKGDLALDALVSIMGDPPVPGRDGTLHDAVGWMAGRIGDPEVHALLVGLVDEAVRDPDLRARLRASYRAPFEATLVEAWPLPAEQVDLAFDVVVGALLHHAAMAGSVSAELVDRVTDVAVGLLAGT